MKQIIEFGSNSCKILQSEAQKIVSDTRIPLRLLSHLDADFWLSEAGQSQILELISRQKAQYPQSEIIALGTHALRLAANKTELQERIKAESGVELRILSEQEEATLAFQGAGSQLNIAGIYLVFDLGGGSLELSFGKAGKILSSHSFPLGALTLDKAFRGGDPYTNCCFHHIQQHIEKSLKMAKYKVKEVLGTGGSLNTMAAVAQKMAVFDAEKVDGYKLSRADVLTQLNWYRAKKIAEIAQLPGMDSNRADIMLPAALVVQQILMNTGVGYIRVCTKGIRHAFI